MPTVAYEYSAKRNLQTSRVVGYSKAKRRALANSLPALPLLGFSHKI